MNDRVTEKNTRALHQGLLQALEETKELRDRVARLEAQATILQANIDQQKHLFTHLLGRGMGSTVTEN